MNRPKRDWRDRPLGQTLRLLSWSAAGWLSLLAIHATPVSAQVMRATTTAVSAQQSFIVTLLQGLEIAQAEQGNEVYVDGTPYAIPWTLRDGQVGIADISLWQAMGVELLDTANPTRQPVQWFSDPSTQPIVLDAWNDGQFRYLEVAPLAEAMGWRVMRTSAALWIETLPAEVLGVRYGRQDWGDRFVIDLNQPTTWDLAPQADGFTLSLHGTSRDAIAPALDSPGNTFQSYQAQTLGDRFHLQIQGIRDVQPVVFTLPNPHRLVIDLRSNFGPTRNIQWAPSVRWRQQPIALGNSVFPVTWLEITPTSNAVALRPIWGDGRQIPGTHPLVTTARQWQAAAAINAGFFNRNNQLPLGALRRESRWFSGPILNRGAIAWSDDGNLWFDRLTLQETLSTSQGDSIPVFSLNSGYVGSGISRYTREWGDRYIPILDAETILTVRQNQISDVVLAPTAGQGTFSIPQDGFLLVARGEPEWLPRLQPGTLIQIQQASVPGQFDTFPNIVGAGPLLVRDRQIVLNATAEQFSEQFAQQQAPRSAIGKTASNTLLLVAVQSRLNGRGPTLTEMAQIMQQIGVTDALNLDGGSSASLYLGGQLINRPARTAARIHNSIGVFIAPPPRQSTNGNQ